MPQLPGLDKAEGRAAESQTAGLPEDVPEALAQLRERFDAERIAATRELESWKEKFRKADAEISRYQQAVAVLVAEDDPRERLKIRDSLAITG